MVCRLWTRAYEIRRLIKPRHGVVGCRYLHLIFELVVATSPNMGKFSSYTERESGGGVPVKDFSRLKIITDSNWFVVCGP